MRDKVQGFLFSGAGNDIIGVDKKPDEKPVPVLQKILKRPADPSSDNPGDYVNMAELATRLAFLRSAYEKVVREIRVRPHFRTLPIFIHGYDVPFPYPWGLDYRRNPRHAAKDQWLGRAFNAVGVKQNHELRRKILAGLINALYDMLESVAGESSVTRVYVVDCRGAMPDHKLWIDEIHGTNEGFKLVAERFRAVIDGALGVA